MDAHNTAAAAAAIKSLVNGNENGDTEEIHKQKCRKVICFQQNKQKMATFHSARISMWDIVFFASLVYAIGPFRWLDGCEMFRYQIEIMLVGERSCSAMCFDEKKW